MKVAFYKAFQSRATWVDNTIAVFSFGRFSHVELVFSNDECFSISARDKVGRFKFIDLHPDRWEVIDLGNDIDEDLIREAASKFIGFEYDYIGALFSIMPICIQKSNKIFCSEVVVNLLVRFPKYTRLGDGCKYSPCSLNNWIKTKVRNIKVI